jgi:hypothetical protein
LAKRPFQSSNQLVQLTELSSKDVHASGLSMGGACYPA